MMLTLHSHRTLFNHTLYINYDHIIDTVRQYLIQLSITILISIIFYNKYNTLLNYNKYNTFIPIAKNENKITKLWITALAVKNDKLRPNTMQLFCSQCHYYLSKLQLSTLILYIFYIQI